MPPLLGALLLYEDEVIAEAFLQQHVYCRPVVLAWARKVPWKRFEPNRFTRLLYRDEVNSKPVFVHLQPILGIAGQRTVYATCTEDDSLVMARRFLTVAYRATAPTVSPSDPLERVPKTYSDVAAAFLSVFKQLAAPGGDPIAAVAVELRAAEVAVEKAAAAIETRGEAFVALEVSMGEVAKSAEVLGTSAESFRRTQWMRMAALRLQLIALCTLIILSPVVSLAMYFLIPDYADALKSLSGHGGVGEAQQGTAGWVAALVVGLVIAIVVFICAQIIWRCGGWLCCRCCGLRRKRTRRSGYDTV